MEGATAARGESSPRSRLGGERAARHLRLRWGRSLPRRDKPGGSAGGRPERCSGADGAGLALGSRPFDGEPRVRAHGRHLPATASQAVRLLGPGVRRQRVQGRRCDADHGGQQPRRGLWAGRSADGAFHSDADGLHDSRHRPERGRGLHSVHDHHSRPAHRDHRRHPGHRLGPPDGLDGDRHPARSGLCLRRRTTSWPPSRRRARPQTR